MTFANGPADLRGQMLGAEEAGSETSCTCYNLRRVFTTSQTWNFEGLP